MPQLDFLLFFQNIGFVAVIFGGLYLHIFMVFLPKAIFFLKLHGKLVEVFQARITKAERKTDLVFCMERRKILLSIRKRISLVIYYDL